MGRPADTPETGKGEQGVKSHQCAGSQAAGHQGEERDSPWAGPWRESLRPQRPLSRAQHSCTSGAMPKSAEWGSPSLRPHPGRGRGRNPPPRPRNPGQRAQQAAAREWGRGNPHTEAPAPPAEHRQWGVRTPQGAHKHPLLPPPCSLALGQTVTRRIRF